MGIFKKIGRKKEETQSVSQEVPAPNLPQDHFNSDDSALVYERIKRVFERAVYELNNVLGHYNEVVSGGGVFKKEEHEGFRNMSLVLASKVELFYELNQFDAQETFKINDYYSKVGKRREELITQFEGSKGKKEDEEAEKAKKSDKK